MEITDQNEIVDLHTHTIASGHGSTDTITDLAREAARRGIRILGITDHGPATPGSADLSYFRSLLKAPRTRLGVRIYYGVEANILDADGTLDVPDELLSQLDYAIISLHLPTFPPVTGPEAVEIHTAAYLKAMNHPGVRFVGHPDDGRYPVDYDHLLQACKERGIYPELNNASLMPEAYRQDCAIHDRRILSLCQSLHLPILLSSDSHGCGHLGDFTYAKKLLQEVAFPQELILNHQYASGAILL